MNSQSETVFHLKYSAGIKLTMTSARPRLLKNINDSVLMYFRVLVPEDLSAVKVILLLLLVFDPCYARASVVRARFLAAAFSDGSHLAHVNGAYLRHVKFCIVSLKGDSRCSSSRLSLNVGRYPPLPGWSKVHDGEHLRPLI